MSSAVYISFEKPISLQEWQEFCNENVIRYNPNTIGHNVFYYDDIEIHFGNPVYYELPKLENGMPDFNKASPENEATKIVVSTYWMGNLEGVAEITKRILSKWKSKYIDSDPEMKG